LIEYVETSIYSGETNNLEQRKITCKHLMNLTRQVERAQEDVATEETVSGDVTPDNVKLISYCAAKY